MPGKHLFPSSFECDCGHVSNFFENTVREMKEMSRKRGGKKIQLVSSEKPEHVILFEGGRFLEVICPDRDASPASEEAVDGDQGALPK